MEQNQIYLRSHEYARRLRATKQLATTRLRPLSKYARERNLLARCLPNNDAHVRQTDRRGAPNLE